MPKHLLFFGTSSFAIPLLRALHGDARFEVVTVITQPDRPTGRKQVMTPPPIKVIAEELGISVFQPERMKAPETLEALKALSFDGAVVASYGQILPQSILDLAPNKFINLHGSILPAYRGASPITEAIKNGDASTGVTVMIMDALMDHGPILHTTDTLIFADDTTDSVNARLADIGAITFGDTLEAYFEDRITAVEQDHTHATTCRLIKKEDALVDSTQRTALEIEHMVRAYTPWPLVQVALSGKNVKLLESKLGNKTDRSPGTLWIENDRLFIACAEGTSLELVSVRPEGSKTMTGTAFFRGIRSN